jgi:hypothetical protein
LVTRCFGPGWCKAFLGFGSTSPFFPWKPFFERWSKPDRLFNHSWQLVGRVDFVSALDQFSRDKQKRVALLIGRAALGNRNCSTLLPRNPPRSAQTDNFGSLRRTFH